MRKILVAGILALVVIGCVVAAGCTSTTTQNTTTTSAEPVVGVWTLPDETVVVFGEDFNGIMASGDTEYSFTWKKTTDGKYQVDREDGAQVVWTLDNIKGTLSNPKGDVLTKQESDTSGMSLKEKAENIRAATKDKAVTRTTNKGVVGVKNNSTQPDQIVGTWNARDSNLYVFRNDNAGGRYVSESDGTLMLVKECTWKKNNDGSYVLDFGDSGTVTATIDAETGQMTVAETGLVMEKQDS